MPPKSAPKRHRQLSDAVATSTDDVVEIILRYASVSTKLDSHDVALLYKIVECCKVLQQEQICSFLVENADNPVLAQYSSDCTPIVTRKVIGQKLQTLRVRRSGKSADEFLVQQQFLSAINGCGTVVGTMLMKEPLVLEHGKSMAALAACALNFGANRLASSPGQSVRISHYVFDRGVSEGMVGTMFAHHQATLQDVSDPALGAQKDLMSWCTHAYCACHDAHNGLKWASMTYFENSRVLSDVYVSVGAFRTCYVECTSHLRTWLQKSTMILPDERLPSPALLTEIWTNLSVPGDVVRVLANKFRLVWQDSRLCVCRSALDSDTSDDFLDELSTALLSLWRFEKFTTSRWCTIGKSCRSVLAGLLSGFPSLIASMRSSAVVSEYYLTGSDRLSLEARRMVAVLALSSYVPESFLLSVLHDARVPSRLQELRETLCSEISFLECVSQSVWKMLGSVCEWSALELRDRVMQAAFVARGFIEFRCLRAAAEWPWKLCTDDPDVVLDGLCEGDIPAEIVARKVCLLTRAGHNRGELKKGLRLLGEASWSTAFTEKQHAAAAIIKRHHAEMGRDALAARAYLYTFRQLLPGTTEHAKAVGKWKHLLETVLARRPQSIKGRQMYFKELMTLASAKRRETTNSNVELDNLQGKVMKLHSDAWNRVSASGKRAFEEKATFARSAALMQKHADIQECVGQLSELAADPFQTETKSMQLSSCPLSTLAIARLRDLFASGDLSPAEVSRRRKKASLCPKPLPACEMQKLQQICPQPVQKAVPKWVKQVARRRTEFVGALFVVESGEQRLYFKFLWGMLSPLQACFLELSHMDHTSSSSSVSLQKEHWWNEVTMSNTESWTYEQNSIKLGTDLPNAELEHIHVVMKSAFSEAGVVSSADVIYPFTVMLEAIPKEKVDKEKTQRCTPTSVPDRNLEEFPWLATVLGDSGGPEAGGTCASSAHHCEPSEAEQVEQNYTALFEELENQRSNWHVESDVLQEQFKIALLGGAWLIRERGKATDAVKAIAKPNSEAEQFCISQGLAKSARFELQLYGERGSSILARAWCHRIAHLMACRKQSANDDEYRNLISNTPYEPTLEMQEVMAGLTGRALERAQGLVRIGESQKMESQNASAMGSAVPYFSMKT